MASRKGEQSRSKLRLSLHWVLFSLTLGVLFLSSLAFIRPISSNDQTVTPSPSALTTAGETLTPEVEETPPELEEIRYTDGIIFCSTILVLILLVGTLRETLRREGR